jgi:hypothetical protein
VLRKPRPSVKEEPGRRQRGSLAAFRLPTDRARFDPIKGDFTFGRSALCLGCLSLRPRKSAFDNTPEHRLVQG